MKEKINGIQRFGIVLIIIGLLFLLFPAIIGTTALLVIAGIVVGIGIYLLISTYTTGSIFLRMAGIFIILTGLIIFFNPGIVLFFIGMSCIISGIGNLYYVSSLPNRNNRSIMYSIFLIVLGGFAAFNTSAAITTIFIILGLLSIIIGIFLVVRGRQSLLLSNFFSIKNKTTTYKKRYDGDIIDVDYHEKKDDK